MPLFKLDTITAAAAVAATVDAAGPWVASTAYLAVVQFSARTPATGASVDSKGQTLLADKLYNFVYPTAQTSGAAITIAEIAKMETVGSVAASSMPTTTIVLASTTYTRPAGLKYATFKAVGGGGGTGGSSPSVNASTVMSSGGGGSGAYVEVLLTAAQIGPSQVLTIGAGGAAGAGTGVGAPFSGGNGGATTIGSLASAGGGLGSFAAASGGNFPTYSMAGGVGGPFSITTGQDLGSKVGEAGWASMAIAVNSGTALSPGKGGSSVLGDALRSNIAFNNNTTGFSVAGVNASANTGAGACGSACGGAVGAAGVNGGVGGSGKIIITEFF